MGAIAALSNGNDAFTTLLLHCDGADASTTFTDSSASPKTVTANGNAQVDTGQSKFGGASYQGDGTSDYLGLADHADFDFPGDFTLDFWLRLAATGTQFLYSHGDTGNAGDLIISLRSAKISVDSNAADSHVLSTTTLSTGTWYHVAVQRSGSTLAVFINGTSEGTASLATNFTTASSVGIGARNDGAFSLNGWIDEFRISKGIARYSGNFTPPTIAYS